MEFRQLIYIITIAEEQNLTRAAARLYVSQSTLSLFLNKLESSLGVLLFKRQKGRLAITSAGQLYVNTAKEILKLKNQLYEELQVHRDERSINIGISSHTIYNLFSDVHARFQTLYPHIHVSLTEGRAYIIKELLKKGDIDLAVYGDWELNQNELYSTELIMKDELLLVMSPQHPLAQFASVEYDNPPVVDISLFADERFVLPNKRACEYHLVKELFRDYNINPVIICDLSNYDYLIQMVLNKTCLTALPSYGVPRDKGLVVCRPGRPYYRYVQFVQRSDKQLPLEANTLKSMLVDAYLQCH